MLGSLRHRLMAGTAMLVLLVLASALVGVSAIRSMDEALNTDLGQVLRANALAGGLLALTTAQMRAGETYLVVPSDSLAREFVSLGDSAHVLHRQLRLLPETTSGDLTALNRIGDNQAAIETAYARAHAWTDLGRPDSARADARRAQVPVDLLTADVQALAGSMQQRIESRTDALRQLAKRRQSLVWLLFISALVIGVVTAVWAIQSIEDPIARLSGGSDRMGQGDLRPVDLGRMPDELSLLGQSVNRMAGRLQTVVEAVAREAREINASAGDFSAMSQELAASSTQIATEMAEVSRTAGLQVVNVKDADAIFHEIRSGVTRNARLASETSDLADRIRSIAEHHRQSITTTSQALQELRGLVRTAYSQVDTLGGQAEQLITMIDRLRDLANRSDVLAVNAAVEAARSTEFGSGFGAVATEIRTLADGGRTSAEAAERVGNALRESLERTLDSLHTGSARILVIEGAAERTANALQEIVTAVEAVSAAGNKVVDGVHRNHLLVNGLADKFGEVQQIAQQHAIANDAVAASAAEQTASTEEMATGATELFEAAQRLQAVIRDFQH